MKQCVEVRSSQRLISFLQETLGESYSGKALRRVLESNGCRVNGQVERFASTRVERGDLVELVSGWQTLCAPQRLSWELLYEDEETKWVNKPAGWVCGEKECREQFGEDFWLIHRLDRETTGVLGIAKGKKALAKWFRLFAEREIHKSYLAIVDGKPAKKGGEIRTFLQRKGFFAGQTIWGSGESGLEAITGWELVQLGHDSSLVRCKPITGRTHQLRVHLAEMGHPIVIDRQYAKKFVTRRSARRPLLHAEAIKTPSFSVQAPLPADLTLL
ncbi:MAG: RluA family pseudouridine synthase [Verrucomicrobiota bacterium]|nr:RluA family pseudouridine synthase [Verrucomicrobiota bacterium]